MSKPPKSIWTDSFFIKEYLKYESVDRVFRQHHFHLPISAPTYHRLISRWGGVGIVKSAGPNSNLSEILLILSRLLDTNLPLETFFRQHVPASLKPTLGTAHRIIRKIKEGVFRRLGTALVVTPLVDKEKVLIGQDISLSNNHFGHQGDISLPMGYSKHQENPSVSIRRILEREVFTNKVINNKFPDFLIPTNPQRFMTINIADVSVKVYHLGIPGRFLKTDQLSSFKLVNHKLIDLNKLAGLKALGKGVRPGVVEIARYYQNLLNPHFDPINNYSIDCLLNRRLALLFSN